MAGPAILTLPLSVILALWLPAVRNGSDAVRASRAVTGTGEPHLVHERGALASGAGTLAELLPHLAPVREVAAILPRPGDPMGAPAVRSADLLDAGEGVLVRRPGDPGGERCGVLVPARERYGSIFEQGELVTWTVDHDVTDHLPAPSLLLAGVESLSHARREIQLALSEAVEALEALDVARDRPDLAEDLLDLSLATVPDRLLPPGLEPRRLDVLERAARLLAIVDLATSDDGAAVTAGQAGARAAALANVERSARHALAAASATRSPL
ncbi:hypothetical protein [Georgenia subflava]|uniref:Uncharacterized protein n=1 Tax=Georgenia subflava TaxID=1622177 RepID=A0A6N7EF24_9MICO|nr:hypothetical protein [Georgenia subflava]MPV35783.1 hypothetical protein [Georgenia subflava]